MDELRAAVRDQPGELRGYLTVVPEIALAQARRPPRFVPRRDDRPLRGARATTSRRSSPRRAARDASEAPRRRGGAVRLDGAGRDRGRRLGDLVARRPGVRGGVGRRGDGLVPARPARRGRRRPNAGRPRLGPRARLGRASSPRAVDEHAADRAGAWFLSAYRRLAGRAASDPSERRPRRAGSTTRSYDRGRRWRGRADGLGRPVDLGGDGANSARPNGLLELLERRNPTTPWGCEPGLKNAMIGMLRMLKACERPRVRRRRRP